MMAENEVTKEALKAVEIEEKCRFDMNSYQDLPKPQCNGTSHRNEANDLDNSYVFVTGTDGLPDDAVDNKDIATENLSVSPESRAVAIEDQGAELDSQNEKLNAVGGEDNEPVNEGENRSDERSNEDRPVVKDSTLKQESSLEDGERAAQDSAADPLEEHTGKIGTSTEAEVKHVDDPGEKAEVEKVGVLGLVAESGENGELDDISSHLNGSGNANDKSKDQINLNTIETLEACSGSQDAIVDVVELKLQDVSVGAGSGSGADYDLKLTREVVESGEHLTPSTSLDSDLESYPIEEELLKDVPENQQCDTALGHNFQGVLEHINDTETMMSSTNGHVESVRDLDLEEKNEDFFVSHVDSGVHSPEKPERNTDNSIASSETMQSEIETEASVPTQSIAATNAHAPQTDIESSDAEAIGAVSSSLVDGPKSEITKKGFPSLPEIECSVAESIGAVSSSLVDGPKSEIVEQRLPSHPEIECSDAEAIGAVSSSLVDGPKSEIHEQGLPTHPEIECYDAEATTAVSSSLVDDPKSEIDEKGLPSHPEIECPDAKATGAVSSSLDGPKSEITKKGPPSLPESECFNAEATGAVSSSLVDGPKSEIDEQGLHSHPEIECSDAEATRTVSSSLVDGPKSEIDEKGLPSHPEIECSDAKATGPVSSSLDGPKSEITKKGPPGLPESECSNAEATGAVSSSLVDGPKSEIDEQELHSHPEIECSDAEATRTVSSSLVDGPKSEITEKGLPSLPEIVCSDAEAIGAVSSSLVDGPKSEIDEQGLPSHPEIECSDAEAAGAVSSSLIDGPKSEIDEQGLPSHPEIECSDAKAIGAVSSSLVDGPKSEITEKGPPSLPESECSNAEATGAVSSSLVDGPKSEIDGQGLHSHPEIECSGAEATRPVSSSLVDGPKSEITEKGLPSHPEIECSDAKTTGAVSSSLVDGPKTEIDEQGLPSHPETECSDAEAIGAVSLSLFGPKSEITEKGLPSLPEIECSDGEASGAVSSSLIDGPESEVTEERPSGHPETESSNVEATGAISSSLIDGPQSEIIEKEPCRTSDASIGSESTLGTIILSKKKPTCQGGEAHVETEVSIGEATVADIPAGTFDVKLKPEVSVQNFSAIGSGEKADDVIVVTEALDSFSVNEGGEANIVEIEDNEDKGDQLDGYARSSNENLFLQENENTGYSHRNNISVASSEGSNANMIGGEEASIKTETKPFNFLIRVPRFDDESLREQIRLAKLHVDEKTKLRDAIQHQIQEIRANSQIHGIDYEYAKTEGRDARKLVRSKRMEIDSLQSIINKAKNALSIEDIDSQIHNMEHMIQHETLPLKEEKQLIREIKQLKQLREQLSSNVGSQDEIKQALEQREEVEERLKILRKELDILKDRVLKAEAVAMEAEKRYDHENKKVRELQAQFRAADDVRQAAYAQWQSLRRELLKKSKHFFKYKDDAAVASNYAFSRDTEALYRLCTNHVDNFMELWNTNDEFRREYIKFNARSTVRRFGTLDGRSLGPDEKPPILPSYSDDRANRMVSTPVKADLASQVPPPNLMQETTVENVTSDGKSTKKVTEHKNQKVTKKEPAITVQVNGLDTVSGRDLSDEVEEEPKKSKEEIEAIRKEEEMRKEKAEDKLKEQRRLEELAKANEARERKKRQAEKLQMRAELKAQKEAEEKEKEKEKRLRKKERKKAVATDVNDIKNNSEPAPRSESNEEISKDIEVKGTSYVKAKKAHKPWFTKQNKTKSVPPPLRNRNKKKWQQWTWVAITSLIIFVLFWLGNIGVFSNVNFRRRSPIH